MTLLLPREGFPLQMRKLLHFTKREKSLSLLLEKSLQLRNEQCSSSLLCIWVIGSESPWHLGSSLDGTEHTHTYTYTHTYTHTYTYTHTNTRMNAQSHKHKWVLTVRQPNKHRHVQSYSQHTHTHTHTHAHTPRPPSSPATQLSIPPWRPQWRQTPQQATSPDLSKGNSSAACLPAHTHTHTQDRTRTADQSTHTHKNMHKGIQHLRQMRENRLSLFFSHRQDCGAGRDREREVSRPSSPLVRGRFTLGGRRLLRCVWVLCECYVCSCVCAYSECLCAVSVCVCVCAFECVSVSTVMGVGGVDGFNFTMETKWTGVDWAIITEPMRAITEEREREGEREGRKERKTEWEKEREGEGKRAIWLTEALFAVQR